VRLTPVEKLFAVSRTPLKSGNRDFTLFSGVKDTAEFFFCGVNDTAGNFVVVSLTSQKNLKRYQRHRYKFCGGVLDTAKKVLASVKDAAKNFIAVVRTPVKIIFCWCH